MPRKRRRTAGEGGIRKRTYTRSDGTIRVRYCAIITTEWEDGLQKRAEGPLRRTEKEALQDLKELNRQKDEGILDGPDPTLAEYLKYWLEQIEPKADPALERSRRQISPKTFKGYQGDVKNHIVPQLGRLKLSKLEPVRLQSWQRKLEAATSPHTARSAAATLSSALTRATQWRIIDRNPYVEGSVMRPVLPEKEASYWEPSEAARFITHEAVKSHPLYVAYYLTLNLGFRMGELRGLKWEDITHLRNRRTGQDEPHIHVQRQAVDDRSDPSITSRLKTKNSDRFIPLPGSTLELLEDWKLAQAANQAKHGDNYLSLGFIATTEYGGSPTTGYLRDEFYRLCKVAGVRKIKFHGLRHTAGSLWLESGVSLLRVSRWLGHSTMRTTEQVYLHIIREASHGESLSLEAMLSIGNRQE
jgi:integrase